MKQLLGCWIRVAISNGGTLTVRRNGWNYEAAMIWPASDLEPISTESNNLSLLLSELEEMLQEDAANEMIERGEV